MAGILDLFDDPQMLGSLLGFPPSNPMGGPPPMPPGHPGGMGGIGSDAARAPGAPQPAGMMPMPAPNPMRSNAMPMPAPNPLRNNNSYAATPDFSSPPQPQPDWLGAGAGISTPPGASVAPPGQSAPDPMHANPGGAGGDPMIGPPPPPPAGPGGIGSDAARTPGMPQPAWPTAPEGVPLPRPAPGQQLPPASAPTAGTTPPISIGQAPAPRPPADQFANPPPGATSGGGLAGAFGLNAPRVRAALAGVGKGLSAVGSQPAGTSMGQSIAAGLGGSLTGNVEQQNKHFDQLSTAFKDMQIAKNSDDTAMYKTAQAAYLTARAQSLTAMTAQGGKGTNAWQNTPLGQVAVVEQRVAAYEGPRRKSIDAQVRSGAISQDDAKKAYEDLDKQTTAFRQNVYKSAGIDPAKGEKLRTSGEKPDNPIDTKGMSLEQFHSQVPLGGWFRDQNGVARQRTVPPPGWKPPGQQSQAAPTGDSTANYQDDQSAMTDAA